MESKISYTIPQYAVSTDSVIFGFEKEKLHVLLIKRGIEPFKDQWALPGGFVHTNETTEACARRELKEETGLDDIYMEQLYTFSQVDRDPRGRVITVAYMALIKSGDITLNAGDDASMAQWFNVQQLPALAFDHEMILNIALTRLKSSISYKPIGFELLPEKFTLSQLQILYESILQRQLDKRNFRKKIEKTGILTKLEEKQQHVAHKPAQLFKFNKEKYNSLLTNGFNFEI